MRIVLAVLSLLMSSPALAQPGVQAAYDAGEWTTAQNLAASASDAFSKTLAAEAVLAPLMLGDMADATQGEKLDRARRAANYAQEALDIDPDYARAYLASAAALGYQGRYSNPLSAALTRLPQRSRTQMDRALALDPGNPWANALLGAWHLEVVRRAGEGMFGADSQAGLERYRAAVRLSNTPDIPYHFALALLARDAEAHGDEALEQLRAAAAMETGTTLEAGMRMLAQSLLGIAETSRSAAAEEAVRRLES
jgi:tetratricopeptide (TPR) repeat protein